VLRDFPELPGIGHITIMESLRCVKLIVWDEDRQRLISSCEAGRRHGRKGNYFR
jgi:acyl-lipid omega-6 desaturase (Delta-12 desaturase)